MDLQEMQNATPAPEPGAAPEKMQETTTTKVNVGISRVDSAGYVWIYRNDDYEPSKCNRNMLPRKLAEVFPKGHKLEGQYIWTTRQPGEPRRGVVKCLLHPDDPSRQHYNELGFVTCFKHNMNSPYQREQHMEHKHPGEWKVIQREQKDREKQEERDFQRSIISNMQRSNDNGFGSNQQAGGSGNHDQGKTGRDSQRRGRSPDSSSQHRQGD